MKLSKYKDDFYSYSAKLSTAVRDASLAGIAVLWIFRTGEGAQLRLPPNLLRAAAAFTVALAAEFLQYAAGTLVWYMFHRYQEKRLSDASTDDPELSHSPVLPAPIWLFFGAKVIAVSVGYWWLWKYLQSV